MDRIAGRGAVLKTADRSMVGILNRRVDGGAGALRRDLGFAGQLFQSLVVHDLRVLGLEHSSPHP
ncbi:hypothetical protein [Demequina sp.]|uniref:hypothetical protein n=1 Tax=Demequina sp. TaxID=2050685 RepID=UPI0025BAF2C2|nr:hypothetical protein [Demequina sp.]